MTQNTSSAAMAIVRFDEDGELSYHVMGDMRLFIVDERAPNDRVYEWLPRCDADEIEAIVPNDSAIGSNADDRHEAIKHRILRSMDGKTHISAVGDGDTTA